MCSFVENLIHKMDVENLVPNQLDVTRTQQACRYAQHIRYADIWHAG